MQFNLRLLGITAAVAMSTLSVSAFAQTLDSYKFTCQFVGPPTAEPIGDRAGHVISLSHYSCTSEGGLADGAIITGVNYYEIDKGNGTFVSGNGAVRKAGSIAIYNFTQGSYTLVMTDGKVTGSQGLAKIAFKFASGTMAPYAGKTGTLKYHTVSGGQFVGETTFD